MPKALSFKGDPKPKKRKRAASPSSVTALTTSTEASSSTPPTEHNDWVLAETATDVSGPVLLVFTAAAAAAAATGDGGDGSSSSSKSQTVCLAADANGAVFASPVENMVEGRPASSEPSSVRQVWVATRVAGSDEVSFRASNERFLGVDREGKASAVREARGVEEGFVLVPTPVGAGGAGRAKKKAVVAGGGDGEGDEDKVDEAEQEQEKSQQEQEQQGLDLLSSVAAPTFHLRSSKGVYLAAVPSPLDPDKVVLRAKRDKMTVESAVIVRMQAKFKPGLEQAKKEKAYEKIGRAQVEREAGRTLTDDEVKRLKKARKRGTYHEEMLDVRAKGKHDKFA